MPRTTDQDLLALTTPGTVLEIDPHTADNLGAFEEPALTEAEALASCDIPPEHLPAGVGDAEADAELEEGA
jgi:hypothetical protein